jgi:hypothetical protein
VGLDVVGVPVEAVLVVRDHDLRPGLPHHLDQIRGGLVKIGAPERARVVVGGQPHHPGVAVTPRAAQESHVAHAQRGARGPQLGDPVAAQLVGVGRGEQGELGDVDLALFAQRARHQRDLVAQRRVVRHRRAGADRLVVRMGVHQQ